MQSNRSGFMANARSQSLRGCSELMSSQIGSVASSVVRITSTYPFPRRSPDRALAAHFGVNEPVTLEKVCLDPKVQWSHVMNVWQNAGARSMLYTMAAPTRWIRDLIGRRNH
jgi:hypothetical protein